ncbi:MAG: hypothetical protein NTY45_13550 [Elusimicrobia bacterium]|nr:hypothetical protein [Elusimicrobiota bacterium]
MTPLNNSPIDDYAALIAALNAHRVEFMIVGAYAVGLHGYIRATMDIDIFVNPEQRNASRVSAALKDFNGVKVNPKEIKKNTMIELGKEPNSLHIITNITGVEWKKAWKSRVQSELGDQPAAFISRECLIENKRACGRDKDKLDLIGLGAEPAQQKTKRKNRR